MLHRTTGSIASCLGAIRAAAVGKVGRAALGARGLAIPARPTLMNSTPRTGPHSPSLARRAHGRSIRGALGHRAHCGDRLFRLHRARQPRGAWRRAALRQVCAPPTSRPQLPLALPDRGGRATEGDPRQSYRTWDARLGGESRDGGSGPRHSRRQPDAQRRREYRQCRLRGVLAHQRRAKVPVQHR